MTEKKKKAEVVMFMGLTVQDIEQYLVTENKKEAEVVNVRLENIKLKNKLKKKEQQLKSKVMPLTVVGRGVQTQQRSNSPQDEEICSIINPLTIYND